ncbi:MAG: hypothetical protein DWQ36_19390 [Acidobacteria bacterium]|nr:MAG: hypothetical protein DWQ30_06250 [Acidobacteriota bacterium]REK03707.1 MAG: hypothetical protein DWQ36_19390 [Acidobacteriota bacterium]
MSRRVAGSLIAAAAVVVAIAIVVALRSGDAPGGGVARPAAGDGDADATFEARLFYPAGGGLLAEHRVEIPEPGSTAAAVSTPPMDARLIALVQRYLDGPAPEGMRLAFPEGTRVQSVDRAPGGVVFVSLALPDGANLQVGSRAELQMVYGLVNSLALSFDDVERVALLWTGVQPTTFAGHVDTTRPLAPSRRWVRSAASGGNS